MLIQFQKEIKKESDQQEKPKLRKARTVDGKRRNKLLQSEAPHLTRSESQNNFRVTDFVNKNFNSLVDEYRFLSYKYTLI